jgi:hypothetical protein
MGKLCFISIAFCLQVLQLNIIIEIVNEVGYNLLLLFF